MSVTGPISLRGSQHNEADQREPGSVGISLKTPAKLQFALIFRQGEAKKLWIDYSFWIWNVSSVFCLSEYFPFVWKNYFITMCNLFTILQLCKSRSNTSHLNQIGQSVKWRESLRESIPWLASKVRPWNVNLWQLGKKTKTKKTVCPPQIFQNWVGQSGKLFFFSFPFLFFFFFFLQINLLSATLILFKWTIPSNSTFSILLLYTSGV